MTKPRVFVGSASESRGVVDALEAELRDLAVVERWDLDVFRPGHFTLEELIRVVREVDFSIFVLGQDDVTQVRGTTTPSPRDNVIFEAGLFTAVLGRERTFFVVDGAGTKIPSDWAGLGYLTFDASQQRPRDRVYDAVGRIRDQIVATQPLQKLGPLAAIIGSWWQFVINSDEGAVLSLMEISASEPANLRLEGRSWAGGGAPLARYRSRAARYDAGNHTLYYYWEGEHPRERTMPHYFGVGEIAFRVGGEAEAERGDGWYSVSVSSDRESSVTLSTSYHRATPDEVVVVEGGDPDSVMALLDAKRKVRQRLMGG